MNRPTREDFIRETAARALVAIIASQSTIESNDSTGKIAVSYATHTADALPPGSFAECVPSHSMAREAVLDERKAILKIIERIPEYMLCLDDDSGVSGLIAAVIHHVTEAIATRTRCGF